MKTMITGPHFNTHFDSFFEGTKKIASQYNENLWEASWGRRYIRISYRGSAFCFVDMTNGDVLKCAGWKAPAKGARGNIFDEWNGLKRMTAYGVEYNI